MPFALKHNLITALLLAFLGLTAFTTTCHAQDANAPQETESEDKTENSAEKAESDTENDAASEAKPQTSVQESTGPQTNGVTFANAAKYKWRIGFKMKTGADACRDLIVTIPVPVNWPEQSVKIGEEVIPKEMHDVEYREGPGGLRQLVAKVRTVRPNTSLVMHLTLHVTVKEIVAPQDKTVFSIPQKVSKPFKEYLGVSPGISYRNNKIRTAVKQIVRDRTSAWEQVEGIYDWVRENIEYREVKPSDSIGVMRAKVGNGEDITGLFVAMCRAHKVPARMVFVEGHQYAEFYLVDDKEEGHWIPCNVAGLRDFGSISDPRVILQKGDNFKVPEKEERQKFVAEHAKVSGRAKPQLGFVRDIGPVDEK